MTADPADPASPAVSPASADSAALAGPVIAGSSPSGWEPATAAMRLQILSTKHWSLLASRGLAWNEAFTRTSMFLSTLSFSGVALALVAQATGFDGNFRLFVLLVLPIMLFLGVSTQLRLDSSNYHDAMCVIGMNRIRASYVAMAPDLEPLFVMGTTDDFQGVTRTMATQPGRSPLLNLLSASPVQVAVLNGMLLGAILALLVVQLGGPVLLALLLAVAGVIVFVYGVQWNARRVIRALISSHRPLFPGPDGAAGNGGSPL